MPAWVKFDVSADLACETLTVTPITPLACIKTFVLVATRTNDGAVSESMRLIGRINPFNVYHMNSLPEHQVELVRQRYLPRLAWPLWEDHRKGDPSDATYQ